MPNNAPAINPSVPARPSTPSIRLKAFMDRSIKKKVMAYEDA